MNRKARRSAAKASAAAAPQPQPQQQLSPEQQRAVDAARAILRLATNMAARETGALFAASLLVHGTFDGSNIQYQSLLHDVAGPVPPPEANNFPSLLRKLADMIDRRQPPTPAPQPNGADTKPPADTPQ